MSSDLTPTERADLRRRHVLCTPCTSEHCRLCGDPNWPCQMIRALDTVERTERLIAWLRLDSMRGKPGDWQVMAGFVLGGAVGSDMFPVIDELSREIDAVMERVRERARQVQP